MRIAKYHIRLHLALPGSIDALVQHTPRSVIHSVSDPVLDTHTRSPDTLTADHFNSLTRPLMSSDLDLINQYPDHTPPAKDLARHIQESCRWILRTCAISTLDQWIRNPLHQPLRNSVRELGLPEGATKSAAIV